MFELLSKKTGYLLKRASHFYLHALPTIPLLQDSKLDVACVLLVVCMFQVSASSLPVEEHPETPELVIKRLLCHLTQSIAEYEEDTKQHEQGKTYRLYLAG